MERLRVFSLGTRHKLGPTHASGLQMRAHLIHSALKHLPDGLLRGSGFPCHLREGTPCRIMFQHRPLGGCQRRKALFKGGSNLVPLCLSRRGWFLIGNGIFLGTLVRFGWDFVKGRQFDLPVVDAVECRDKMVFDYCPRERLERAPRRIVSQYRLPKTKEGFLPHGLIGFSGDGVLPSDFIGEIQVRIKKRGLLVSHTFKLRGR